MAAILFYGVLCGTILDTCSALNLEINEEEQPEILDEYFHDKGLVWEYHQYDKVYVYPFEKSDQSKWMFNAINCYPEQVYPSDMKGPSKISANSLQDIADAIDGEVGWYLASTN